jgi:nucleoid-associated protein YgaU
MAISPLKALFFLAGGVVAALAVAWAAGGLDPLFRETGPVAADAPDGAAQKGDRPAGSAEQPSAPSSSAEVIPPSFDILRVEPNGSIVIAGKAAPGAAVEILTGSQAIAQAEAGREGDFVAVLEEPLKPGDYQIVLRSTTPENVVAASPETAIVSIPDHQAGQVLALVEQPGAPSKLITVPDPAPAPKTDGPGAPATPQPAQGEAEAPKTLPLVSEPVGAAEQPEPSVAKEVEPNAAAHEESPAAPPAEEDSATQEDTAMHEESPAAPPAEEDSATQEDTAMHEESPAAPPAEEDSATQEDTAMHEESPAAPPAEEDSATQEGSATQEDSAMAEAEPDTPDRTEAAPTETASDEMAADPGAPKAGIGPLAAARQPSPDIVAPEPAQPRSEPAQPETAPLAPEPAELPPAAAVAVEAVEIEGRKVFVAGIADPGSAVRVYANDVLLGETQASEGGRFLIETERDLPVGDYIIRADMLARDGSVVARAAVPFEREEGEAIAAVAPPSSPRSAASVAEAPAPRASAPQTPSPVRPVQRGDGPAAAPSEDEPGSVEQEAGEQSAPAEDRVAAAPSEDGPGSVEQEAVEQSASAEDRVAAAPSEDEPGSVEQEAVDQNAPAEDRVAAAPSEDEPGSVEQEAVDQSAPAEGRTAAAPVRTSPLVSDRSARREPAAPAAEQHAAAEPARSKPADAPEAETEAAQGGAIRPQPGADAAAGPPAVTAPKLQAVDGSVIIRRGDNLWRISRRVYGRGVRYTTIYLANEDQIRNPHMIFPGQVFTVPEHTSHGEPADLEALGQRRTTVPQE